MLLATYDSQKRYSSNKTDPKEITLLRLFIEEKRFFYLDETAFSLTDFKIFALYKESYHFIHARQHEGNLKTLTGSTVLFDQWTSQYGLTMISLSDEKDASFDWEGLNDLELTKLKRELNRQLLVICTLNRHPEFISKRKECEGWVFNSKKYGVSIEQIKDWLKTLDEKKMASKARAEDEQVTMLREFIKFRTEFFASLYKGDDSTASVPEQFLLLEDFKRFVKVKGCNWEIDNYINHAQKPAGAEIIFKPWQKEEAAKALLAQEKTSQPLTNKSTQDFSIDDSIVLKLEKIKALLSVYEKSRWNLYLWKQGDDVQIAALKHHIDVIRRYDLSFLEGLNRQKLPAKDKSVVGQARTEFDDFKDAIRLFVSAKQWTADVERKFNPLSWLWGDSIRIEELCTTKIFVKGIEELYEVALISPDEFDGRCRIFCQNLLKDRNDPRSKNFFEVRGKEFEIFKKKCEELFLTRSLDDNPNTFIRDCEALFKTRPKLEPDQFEEIFNIFHNNKRLSFVRLKQDCSEVEFDNYLKSGCHGAKLFNAWVAAEEAGFDDEYDRLMKSMNGKK